MTISSVWKKVNGKKVTSQFFFYKKIVRFFLKKIHRKLKKRDETGLPEMGGEDAQEDKKPKTIEVGETNVNVITDKDDSIEGNTTLGTDLGTEERGDSIDVPFFSFFFHNFFHLFIFFLGRVGKRPKTSTAYSARKEAR